MKFLCSSILALLLTFAPAAHATLENDCAIVATEAYAKVAPYACWARLLAFKFIDLDNKVVAGHVMVAWQATPHGRVLIYDSNGTIPLETHSTKLKDIIAEINKDGKGHVVITEAMYVE